MERLGYTSYGAHGGAVGAGITGRLASLYPDSVIGTLVNSDRGSLDLAGEQLPIPDHLTEDELGVLEPERESWKAERGYLDLQPHRPETIAAALTDSPIAQLAWITEKFQTWTNPSATTSDQAVSRDKLLTNITLYWFTRTGATAARFLWEAAHSGLSWLAPSTVPAGWSVCNTTPVVRCFMDPTHQAPFWSDHPDGGHFAAMEAPAPANQRPPHLLQDSALRHRPESLKRTVADAHVLRRCDRGSDEYRRSDTNRRLRSHSCPAACMSYCRPQPRSTMPRISVCSCPTTGPSTG
ncbi:hypothetical protein EV138_5624 [Kribbella voronezhensis]|uniref:Alpha/beta hydrolase family protein n=2 Tax=Kribbella voronezhensis TaxID=2512212 RepID=A0A4R7SVG5_9ACTN|nr:hypothetical protein EV138_5624 [Kribbella voronezhensis]